MSCLRSLLGVISGVRVRKVGNILRIVEVVDIQNYHVNWRRHTDRKREARIPAMTHMFPDENEI
jgi:hypothetical protein